MVIANMGTILNTLTIRMEGLEMQRATQDDTAALHLQYPSVPAADIRPAAVIGPPTRQTPAEFHTLPDVSEEIRA